MNLKYDQNLFKTAKKKKYFYIYLIKIRFLIH